MIRKLAINTAFAGMIMAAVGFIAVVIHVLIAAVTWLAGGLGPYMAFFVTLVVCTVVSGAVITVADRILNRDPD